MADEDEEKEEIIEILTDPVEAANAFMASAKRLTDQGLPASYAKLGVVEENQYWRVIRDPVRFPGGQLGTYHRVVVRPEYLPAVSALPVLGDEIVLIRIFRHPLRKFVLETPRGFGTPGMAPEEGVRLELEEEIGVKITQMIDLGQAFLSSGLSDEYCAFYLAHLESIGEPAREEGIAEIVRVPIPEFERMAAAGEITDSFTLIAFLRARLRGLV